MYDHRHGGSAFQADSGPGAAPGTDGEGGAGSRHPAGAGRERHQERGYGTSGFIPSHLPAGRGNRGGEPGQQNNDDLPAGGIRRGAECGFGGQVRPRLE